MTDLLSADFINSLPQPILGRDLGGGDWWWPIYDFEVDSAMCRIDVSGKLQPRWVIDFSVFKDADGVEYQPEELYTEHRAEVIGYCWEVNAEHPRLPGQRITPGGEDVALGQRGPFFDHPPYMNRPWGLTQIWIMRNGQEVRATWKERT